MVSRASATMSATSARRSNRAERRFCFIRLICCASKRSSSGEFNRPKMLRNHTYGPETLWELRSLKRLRFPRRSNPMPAASEKNIVRGQNLRTCYRTATGACYFFATNLEASVPYPTENGREVMRHSPLEGEGIFSSPFTAFTTNGDPPCPPQ